ncbi:hypothetical protein SADUNF_Sadunf16G0025500 [Salix dunnii]|uniref:SKP1 component POZ domain-containing protein n=1 Tax=Salix dunnii TaxID=1413687 RepID=A0A835J8S7_9ROSI|nr:hypothetical protein SADUNF_Sadunf16G0025500 [Salix dunnii]
MASSAETTITESTRIVRLKTSDEEIFEVEESVATEMVIVKSFLVESPSAGTVPLLNVLAKPFSQFIEFCKERIINEELLDMFNVAKCLVVKDLFDLLRQAVADRIQNKSVEYTYKKSSWKD